MNVACAIYQPAARIRTQNAGQRCNAESAKGDCPLFRRSAYISGKGTARCGAVDMRDRYGFAWRRLAGRSEDFRTSLAQSARRGLSPISVGLRTCWTEALTSRWRGGVTARHTDVEACASPISRFLGCDRFQYSTTRRACTLISRICTLAAATRTRDRVWTTPTGSISTNIAVTPSGLTGAGGR